MSNQPSVSSPGIPRSVQVFTWALSCAGLFFAYVFAFNPGLSFP